MHFISISITYILLFVALYFEVFLLITYFEMKLLKKDKKILIKKNDNIKLYSVSIIVPVWNEESTIIKTVFSLLKLNYPKDKLKIFIVDDGSTDNTFKVLQRFKKNKQITILQKENGGKHSALNYALTFIDSDLVGCLDADSFVDSEALMRIVARFNKDKSLSAVTPSIKVYKPKTLIQFIQRVEYEWGVLFRNILANLNALYVTPGPFTIFKREIFTKFGGYKHAYLTEDMEMALRMQSNKLKIGNVANAFVFTVAPNTIKKLYKQRLRWTYGFLKNTLDYKYLLFKSEYGNLGVMVLPAAGISIFSSIFVFFRSIYTVLVEIVNKFVEWNTIGLNFILPDFDLFYVNTNITAFIAIFAILVTVTLLMFAIKMSEGKFKFRIDMVLFMLLYGLIAPFWMFKAVFNVIFKTKTSWR